MINTLVFSPNRYWLCAGTERGITIWDLESKSVRHGCSVVCCRFLTLCCLQVVAELNASAPDFHLHAKQAVTLTPQCLSLAWSDDGSTLYAGYTDSMVRFVKTLVCKCVRAQRLTMCVACRSACGLLRRTASDPNTSA